ncbi:MAG: hypothetical protein IJ017_07250 [Oscillospiraceae bacterium]|nr:hypothetical protein [Oscillospiraceae bacterium]
MNRYNAKNGRVSRVHEAQKFAPAVQKQTRECAKKQSRDMGDFWVLAVFFLLYLESRDTDFLIILAVLAFYMFDVGDLVKRFGV